MFKLALMLYLLAAGGGHGGVVYDLGVVIAGAAVAVLVFHRLKLPTIFGYLAAGLILGGGVGLPSPVGDKAIIQELSELGVIFLLFFIGMEFDLRRLKKLFWPASAALLIQTLTMLYLAQLVAPLVGWDTVNALFFGSLLAISSSMVTVKVLRDQGRMQMPHAQIAVGILILEDILAVILLVILTGVAVTKQFDWDAAWLVIFFMGVFIAAVFSIGRILIPRLLESLGDPESHREEITLLSAGLVLGVSIFALRLQFSPALGAFIAGAILSQTKLVHAVEAINRSLHDLFSAVFFVTVGMLIEPRLILENLGWIIGLSILVVIGKIGSCWMGMFLAGQPARTSYRAASAKSQIGEFSFIIASLGMSLGVTDDRLTGIAFGIALLTILQTPLVAKYSGEIFDFMSGMLPNRVRSFGEFYHELIENLVTMLGRNRVIQVITRPLSRIGVNFLLMNAVLIGGYFLADYLEERFRSDPTVSAAVLLSFWFVVAIGLAPVFLGIIRNLNAIVYELTEAVFESEGERPIMQGRLRTVFNGVIVFVSGLVVGVFYLSFASPWLPAKSVTVVVIVFLLVIGLIFWRQLAFFNERMEGLLLDSFRAQVQDKESAHREAVLAEVRNKYPWEVEVKEIVLSDDCALAGKRLSDSKLREQTGATIIALGRGNQKIFDPGPGAVLFSGDSLFVLGNTEQIALAAQALTDTKVKTPANTEEIGFDVRSIYLSAGSAFDGNTLAGAAVRERFGINVIGVQRGDERITSPKPDLMLHTGDVLYAVGRKSGLDSFTDDCQRPGKIEEEATFVSEHA